jgi:hypothetical protein
MIMQKKLPSNRKKKANQMCLTGETYDMQI